VGHYRRSAGDAACCENAPRFPKATQLVRAHRRPELLENLEAGRSGDLDLHVGDVERDCRGDQRAHVAA
jgi:hypothetical protein